MTDERHRCNKICVTFYEIVDLASESEEVTCNLLIGHLNGLTRELVKNSVGMEEFISQYIFPKENPENLIRGRISWLHWLCVAKDMHHLKEKKLWLISMQRKMQQEKKVFYYLMHY